MWLRDSKNAFFFLVSVGAYMTAIVNEGDEGGWRVAMRMRPFLLYICVHDACGWIGIIAMPLRLLLECENMALWRCEKGLAVGVVCDSVKIAKCVEMEEQKERRREGLLGKRELGWQPRML